MRAGIGLVIVAGTLAGGRSGGGSILSATGVGIGDDFVMSLLDLVLHVLSIRSQQVVGAHSQDSDGGQKDQDIEGSEQLPLGLLFEGGDVHLGQGRFLFGLNGT